MELTRTSCSTHQARGTSCSEVPAGGVAELLPEHGAEGARRAVPDGVGHRGHGLALGEAPQRVEQAEPLTPPADGHAGLDEEGTFERATARARVSRPHVDPDGR